LAVKAPAPWRLLQWRTGRGYRYTFTLKQLAGSK